jgi:xanthine dehydrogenase YagR molybdenum-binding subunit
VTSIADLKYVGRDVARIDGPAKVTGTAPYAYDQPVSDPLYLYPVRTTIARGRVTAIDATAALDLHESVHVLTAENAAEVPEWVPGDLRVLQDDTVSYHGQLIGAVLGATPEIARHAADLVRVSYEPAAHDTELRADHPDRYAPKGALDGTLATDVIDGDLDAGLSAADVTIDRDYHTSGQHHVAMEPNTAVATWTVVDGADRVTLYDSNQGAFAIQLFLAPMLGLAMEQLEVISPFVGGSFGSKTIPRPLHVLVALAARTVPGRPVKFALARQHTFVGTAYRTPTSQRVRLGARRDGTLTAIGHDVVAQTARFGEFAEPAAVSTRTVYAAESRATTHRLVRLDVSMPGFMRAPGEAPGSFAVESAMDELAVALGIDPIELRIRNEPASDPESGRPFSSRDLVWCLREGASRFGWAERDPAPRRRLEDGWWLGTGVAAANYPRQPFLPSTATVQALTGGRYRVALAASDLGTGAFTILTQIAADSLGVALEDVELAIGSSVLPQAFAAAGSMGTVSWSEAILAAVDEFRRTHGDAPAVGAQSTAAPTPSAEHDAFAMHAFGAQFAEVAVHADTGEIRARRLLGAFDVGRVVNPRTARSQLVGGMVMGMSMALHEHSVMDHRYGHVITNDLASYHVAAQADIPEIEAFWLGTPDPRYSVLGTKGLAEIGVVGVAAAIANAAWHATGTRVRSLPITLDNFLTAEHGPS